MAIKKSNKPVKKVTKVNKVTKLTKLTKKSKSKEVRKAWVKALRSGKYKQTKGQLARCTKDGKLKSFCCLGVLCDLAVKAKVIPSPILDTTDCSVEFRAQEKETTFRGPGLVTLPLVVKNWAGLSYSNGRYSDYHEYSLAGLNDNGKKSFKYIANVIEKEPKGLVKE